MYKLNFSEKGLKKLSDLESELDAHTGPLAVSPELLKKMEEEEEINYEWNLEEEEKEDK